MFDKKLQSIADSVKQVLGMEEIDPKVRTKDTTKGQEPTKQKDDVGPGGDGKSTKVKFRAGPLNTEGFKDKLFNSLTEEKLDEAQEEMLARYMKSRGYNPETTPKDKKIAITKSNEFKKWLNDHQFEETQYDSEEYSEEQLDEMINEVLSKDATAGDWVHDFVHSDNPKFKGKTASERKKQALAAYYAHQREEVESMNEMDYGNDDNSPPYHGHGYPKNVNKPKGPDVYVKAQKAKDTKKDMLKALNKSFQQKEEVELEEGKRPETDSVPWVDDKGEKAQPDVKDKGTGGMHTPMSRAKHLARIALKKVKNEVLGKAGMTSEEFEQVEEGAFSSGALKLTPQGKKKFADLHKSMKSTSTVRDKDEKGTYTSVRVKNAGESDYKEISRKYDKE